MKLVNHFSIGMTFVCIFLGFIIGLQLKTVKSQVETTDTQRLSEISAELKRVKNEYQTLKDRLEESEYKNTEYEESLANENNAYKLLLSDLEKARLQAGLIEVKGRGVQVTMNDSKATKSEGTDANAYLVHAEDILSVINELNVAGAEAISINDQRIVGTSSVRCVGPIVNINGVRVAAPFVISAIGDPEVLESALKFPGGVVDSLTPWGIEVTIKRSTEVIIPAYNQVIQYNELSVNSSESAKKEN